MGMQARAREIAPVAALMGAAGVFWELSRELLETRGICEDQMSRAAWVGMVVLYALFLAAMTCPMCRRIRWMC
jgi:uncharacterized membrane protein